MIRSFALWLLRLIEENLDPSLKADIEAYEAKKKEKEDYLAQLNFEIGQLNQQIATATAERDVNRINLKTAEAAADELEAKTVEVVNQKPVVPDKPDDLFADLSKRSS